MGKGDASMQTDFENRDASMQTDSANEDNAHVARATQTTPQKQPRRCRVNGRATQTTMEPDALAASLQEELLKMGAARTEVADPTDLVGIWSSADHACITVLDSPLGVFAGFGATPNTLNIIESGHEEIELNGWKLVDRSKKRLRWQKHGSLGIKDGMIVETDETKEVIWIPKDGPPSR